MANEHLQDSAGAEPIDFAKAKAQRILYTFVATPKDIMRALYSRRFDFSKQEFILLAYLLDHMIMRDGTLNPFRSYPAEIAKALDSDKSNVTKTIKALATRFIVVVDGEHIGVNLDVKAWQEVVDSTTGSGRNNHRKVVKPTTSSGENDHLEVVGPTTGSGKNDHLPVVEPTTTTSPNLSNNQGFEDPLDHPKIQVDLLHGDPTEDLQGGGGVDRPSEGSTTEKSIEPVDQAEQRRLIMQAVTVLRDGGYVGPRRNDVDHTLLSYKPYIEFTLLRKASDPERDFEVSTVEYLRDYIIPALTDLPKSFRGSFAAYDKELTMKLAKCRKRKFYANYWEEEAKPSKGMATVSDFSGLEEDTVSDF